VCGARREAFLNSLAVEFCYLGDMLSVDGDADAAVEARVRIDWNKFRQLVPLLITPSGTLYLTTFNLHRLFLPFAGS